MKRHEAEKLIAVIRELARDLPEDQPTGLVAKAVGKTGIEIGPRGPETTPGTPADFEGLYQKIKRRLLDELRVDPIFVRLIASQPEILLEVEPRRVSLDGSTLRGRVCQLVAAGFLDDHRRPGEIIKELGRIGAQTHPARLSEALKSLKLDGILTDEDEGYRKAPGLKVSKVAIEAA